MNELLRGFLEPLVLLLDAGLRTFYLWGAPPGLAIVLLTVVVRALLLPLTLKQVSNARKLRELKPDLDGIRVRYKDDPKKQREELAKLQAERGFGALGGCLPVLVQLPIFLALYFVVGDSGTLEGFGDGGLVWFRDLTAPDPLYVLPVVYVLTMILAQEPAMVHVAPQQRKLMRLLPLAFGLFLVLGGFPAGLFVYWISSNLISLLQNLLIHRQTAPQNRAED